MNTPVGSPEATVEPFAVLVDIAAGELVDVLPVFSTILVTAVIPSCICGFCNPRSRPARSRLANRSGLNRARAHWNSVRDR